MIKSRKEFIAAVKEESAKFKPFGKKIGSFVRKIQEKEDELSVEETKKPKAKTKAKVEDI